MISGWRVKKTRDDFGRVMLCMVTLFFFHSDPFAHAGKIKIWNAYQTSLFSGSYSYDFELNPPSATRGEVLQIPLSYKAFLAPDRGGAGWEISRDHVQANSDGTFSLFLNGSKHDLILVAGGGYRTKTETYLKIDNRTGGVNKNGAYWTVLDTDGTEHRFGANPDSENLVTTGDPTMPPATWRWSLDRIKDANGNCIYYSYVEDRGAVYPYRIEYNNDRQRVIEFVLEDRPDPYWTVEQGSEIYVAKRLSRVDITVSGKLVKSFKLNYADITPLTPTSLLTSITKSGTDGSSLPPSKFSYKPLNPSFGNYSSWNPQSAPIFRQVNTTNAVTSATYDINGDGFPDQVDGSVTPWKVSLNNGNCANGVCNYMASMDWSGAPAGPLTTTDAGGNVTRDLIDINGDGLPDVVAAKAGGAWDVYLNTGNGFTAPISWSVPVSDGFIRTVATVDGKPVVTRDLLDTSGDGVVDVVNKSAAGWQRALNNSGQAWLLETVTENLGGTTTISYAPSASYPDVQLPTNYWVVSSITRDNGLPAVNPQHTSATTRFSYTKGRYDTASNEFRGFGQVTEIRPDGSQVVHTYNQDDGTKGKEARALITDPKGQPVTETVNTWTAKDSNNVGVYTVTLDRVDQFTYDGTSDHPKQTATEFQYDPYGNITQETRLGDVTAYGDELITVREYRYDTDLYIVDKLKRSYSSATPGGPHLRESWFDYDNAGNLKREEHFLDTGGNPVTTYEYDSYGNRTVTVDPEGRRTTVEYDDVFHTFPVRVTNAKGQTTVREFNPANGQPTMVTDPNGFVTSYKYDVFNRLWQEIKPYDSETFPTTEMTYLLDGTAPEGVKVAKREQSGKPGTLDAYQFVDGFGRLLQSKSEYKNSNNLIATDVYYDVMGREFKHSNPYLADPATDYRLPLDVPAMVTDYDSLGRTTRTTNADGTYSTVLYDHWTTTTTDENGHARQRSYDANHNLRQVIEKNTVGVSGGALTSIDESYVTTYLYNPLGELLQTVDHLGNTASYLYDTLGRKVTVRDPDHGRKDYSYDRVGNLTSQTDARGITTNYTFDPLNRLLQVTYPKDSPLQYTYDREKIGTLSQVKDGLGTVSYQYDNRLRQVREDRSMDGITWTTRWEYDALDRAISQTYPDGDTAGFSYNTMGKLSAVSPVLGAIDYDEKGQETVRTYANGLSTSFAYNPASQRLTNISTSGLQDYVYGYDKVGNVQSIIGNASNAVTKRTETFSYDDLDRLVNAVDPASDGYRNTYQYNAIGNMLSETDVKGGTSTVAQFTYGLGGAGPHAVTGKSDAKPMIGIYTPNNGKSYTTTSTITLNNVALGQPTEYLASEQADFAGATWQPYSAAPAFNLSGSFGRKTIYFKVRNASGETTVKSGDVEFLRDSTNTGVPDIYNTDMNNNGFPDDWERAYGITQPIQPSMVAPSGLTYLQAYQYGTDPNKIDTDNDGWSDYQEVNNLHTNPNSAGADNVHDAVSSNYAVNSGRLNEGSSSTASASYSVRAVLGTAISVNSLPDTDGDGIADIIDPDTDGDGIPDTWERANGINITVAGHAQLDADHDGVTNLVEYLHGTNPQKVDSNGDGWSDYQEIYLFHNDPNSAVISNVRDASSETYSIGRAHFDSGAGTRSGAAMAITDTTGNSFSAVALQETATVIATPALVDFGTVKGGVTAARVTVTNSGSGNLALGGISLSGDNPLEFGYTNDSCSNKTLAPSGTCSFDVQFVPSFGGGKGALLALATDDRVNPSLTVTLGGVADGGLVDTTPPSATFAFSRKAPLTNSANVLLALSATDPSGVSQMCISNSNICSQWEKIAVEKSWVLPAGDGTKTVYAWFRDNAGNSTAAPYTASIVLDTAAPGVRALVAGGLYSKPQSVTLASDEVATVYYTLTGINPTTASPVYSAPILLASSAPLKFFAVDAAGNQSDIRTETYTIDGVPPTGNLAINNGAPYTRSPQVVLNLSATDNVTSQPGMQTSLDNKTWSDWEPAAMARNVTLSSGDGVKYAYARFNDQAGNVSQMYSSTIMLDTVPPSDGSVSATVGDGQNALTWSGFNDASSGIGSYRLVFATAGTPASCDAGTTLYNGPLTGYVHSGLQNGITYYYRVCAVDRAGNVSSGATQAFVPSPTLTVSFAGTGGGSVHGDLTCSSGSTCPPVPFANRSSVTLMATPDTNSLFGGWSGPCTVAGNNCSVLINGSQSVTVTFNAAARLRILGGTEYSAISAAYAAAANNAVLQARAVTFDDGNIILGRPIAIYLFGGYNADFNSKPGETVVKGKLLIRNGTVRVDGLTVR
jgi:YD repeat-containing protein